MTPASPQAGSPGVAAGHGAPDARLTRVLEAIEQNPSLDVPALARLASLSPSRLQHLFRERLGMAIRDAVAEQKLRRAVLLVVNTDLTIKEITFEVGYGHSSSFVRAFRKRFSAAPQTYRKSRQSPTEVVAESANLFQAKPVPNV